VGSELPYNAFHNNWREQCFFPVISGRISDLLKFLVPKVGESFVLDHNVESQEVGQARHRRPVCRGAGGEMDALDGKADPRVKLRNPNGGPFCCR